MYGNLQLIEGWGVPSPTPGMNRRQAREFLRNLRRKCDRLRRMAREAAKSGDRRRARVYFQKFRKCKGEHMALAEKMGLGRKGRPGGHRRGGPLRVGMRTMVAGEMPSPSAKGGPPVMRMDGYGFGFYGDPDDEPEIGPESEIEIAIEDPMQYGFLHGDKRPSLMKMGMFAAIGAVAVGMHGKTKKQKRNATLIGAGIGAAASYLF